MIAARLFLFCDLGKKGGFFRKIMSFDYPRIGDAELVFIFLLFFFHVVLLDGRVTLIRARKQHLLLFRSTNLLQSTFSNPPLDVTSKQYTYEILDGVEYLTAGRQEKKKSVAKGAT